MINGLTKIHNPLGNPYIHYYLGQQDGRGMPVFRGSSWQRGYRQTGYGLGGLFRSLGKIARSMIKSGAKALGNIALTSGVNLLGDVLAGNKHQTSSKNPCSRRRERCKDASYTTSAEVCSNRTRAWAF